MSYVLKSETEVSTADKRNLDRFKFQLVHKKNNAGLEKFSVAKKVEMRYNVNSFCQCWKIQNILLKQLFTGNLSTSVPLFIQLLSSFYKL